MRNWSLVGERRERKSAEGRWSSRKLRSEKEAREGVTKTSEDRDDNSRGVAADKRRERDTVRECCLSVIRPFDVRIIVRCFVYRF